MGFDEGAYARTGSPPGGRGALATWEDLHAELTLMRDEVVVTIRELTAGLRAELRGQTRWLAFALLVTVALEAAILTVFLPA